MKKKIVAIGIGAVLAVGAVAAAHTAVNVWFNDHEIPFEVEPYIENERTMVPLYAFCEEMGWDAYWNDEDQSAGIYNGRYEVEFYPGQSSMWVYDYLTEEDKEIPIDAQATIEGDRVMIPVRALSEAFGVTVEWDEKNQRVNLISTNEDETYYDESDVPIEALLEGLNISEDYEGFDDYEYLDDSFDDIGEEEIVK